MQMIARKAQRAPVDPDEHPSSQPNEDAEQHDQGGILQAPRYPQPKPRTTSTPNALDKAPTPAMCSLVANRSQKHPQQAFPDHSPEKVSDPLC